MAKEKKVGLLYLGLHNQLVKKYGVSSVITRKEFFCKLGKHYMIPKDLRYWIIKEMENANLIERINRDNLKLLKCKVTIDGDKRKILEMINL